MKDGWNSYFHYGTNTHQAQDYVLASTGKDGTIDATSALGPTTDFNLDIIFADGQFIAYPEGTQQ